MASIGNQITSTSFVVDTFSGTGSQTSFTGLTFSPASTAAIAVHVAGVYQAPSVYSLSGTTLTFSSAPALGTSNIQVLHLGTGATAGVPSDGSVTTAKIADGAITADKIADGTIIAADIAANTVTPAKLAYNAAGTILTTDGATVLWRAQSALAIANTQITGNIISSQITSVANTQVTGIMGVAQGGTASSTLTANSVLIGNGTSALKLVAPGTSGNVLSSDGTNWASTAAATSSGGASTVSQGTSLTLTSASNRVQVVSLTAGSLSVILPDATTLSAGGPTFIITNAGTNGFTVKQNGGIVLASLTSGQSVMCEVYDISTATGKWTFSNKDIASFLTTGHFVPVTIDSTNAAFPYASGDSNGQVTGNALAGSFVDCLKLTSTTALLVWTRLGNKSVYGVVATNTSGVISYGTIVQIYDGSAGGTAAVQTAAAMLLSGLTTGMVFIGRSATGIVVPFSISGATITVGTASANIGNKATYNHTFHSVAVLSSTVMMIVYNDATFTNILVATMTYNGASAPTLGTPTAGIATYSNGNASPQGTLLTLTSTTAQLWYLSVANTLATRVVTSNGASAPTLGTAITATATSALGQYPDNMSQAYAYSATETSIIFQPQYDAVPYVASYTISGTTVTQTSAPAIMSNLSFIGMPSRLEWVTSTTGLFFQSYNYSSYNRYLSLSKLYQATYTPSGGTILYVPLGNTPDPNVYTYLAGMCLLSSTTGIMAGYNSTTGYISANVFTVL